MLAPLSAPIPREVTMKRRIGISLVAVVMLVFLAACGKSTPTQKGAFGLSKDATLAAEVPSAIRSKGTLTIGTDASYAPSEFYAPDNTTIIGMDVDLGNAIGTVLGLKVQFVNAKFDTIITSIAGGRFDLGMSSFTDNTDREKTVDMVDYFQAGASIFVASNSTNNFTTLDQLCGKPVSVESGTTELDDISAQQPKCIAAGKPKIIEHVFPTQNGANLDVTTGRAVASLADTPVAQYQVKVTNGAVKVTGEYLSPAPYGIAIPRPVGTAPGSAPLTKSIFDAVQKIFSSGAYMQILNKWGIASGAIAAPKINGATG